MRVTGISGMDSYRISSVHGNPYSMNRIQQIQADTQQSSGKALVIASKKPEEDLYVKDYGQLEPPKSTATGDFAELLSIQESKLEETETGNEEQAKDFSAYLNDTIGVMGLQNHLREQLLGTGFEPFTAA